MIAKLVTTGETREESIDRMIQAIDDYEIAGLRTTLDFGKYVMKHTAFRSGDFDTNFVKHYFSDPQVMLDAQDMEEKALTASLDAIYSRLTEVKNNEFKSESIHTK
jgi:propionyl-CoA carboxylase alpha chain